MLWHVLIANGLRGWLHADDPIEAARMVLRWQAHWPADAKVLVLDKNGVQKYSGTVAECREQDNPITKNGEGSCAAMVATSTASGKTATGHRAGTIVKSRPSPPRGNAK